MHGNPSHADPTQSRRVELILQQLDALPTLSAIAVRVLELTADDESEMRDVIRLVSSDPALASKVLKVCRCSDRGRAANVTNVDRAVVLLGFDAVRSAVLSVQVFELFEGAASSGGELYSGQATFDRQLFWQHSLAVAITAEHLCHHSALKSRFQPSEAFVGGLLHDLGQLCLHLVLPRSFDRVCEMAVAQTLSLDLACRQTIGVDTHTAGRRIAEHWQLPHQLGDVIWLNGQPYDSLPALEHKALIGLVSLADAVVRREHITPLGHGPRGEDLVAMGMQIGIDEKSLRDAIPALHDELSERAEIMGLNGEHCTRQLLRSVCRANEVLGRANVILRQNVTGAKHQSRSLEAIRSFHDSASPGGSVVSILSRVVQSATEMFGEGVFCVLYQANQHEPWQFYQFDTDGRLQHSQIADFAEGALLTEQLADNPDAAGDIVDFMPSLASAMMETTDLQSLRVMALQCGWGVNALLLHNRTPGKQIDRTMLEALSRTWGAAIAGGTQHEGAKRLGEQLAEANRQLVETQDRLAQVKTMAALGELAAGAAHEMNNPLTVISGRSQLLANTIIDHEQRAMARQIAQQAHRLSDIITALRLFAEPTQPKRRSVDIQELINDVASRVTHRRHKNVDISTIIGSSIPNPVFIDPDQIGRALGELLQNAIESEGSTHVELRVQIDPADDRLRIQVTDDGAGLAPYTLAHAFDPFFSAKPAGRQPGLGLSQAQRLVEASGGRITLENGAAKGAVATIWLPRWQDEREKEHARDVA